MVELDGIRYAAACGKCGARGSFYNDGNRLYCGECDALMPREHESGAQAFLYGFLDGATFGPVWRACARLRDSIRRWMK